ncbi:hypothetical protein KAZ66_01840 [Candidatus Woesebacteria bacterium]|nr:hypothetical protein [Candidatus Woesebacteria bacterium]
MKKATKTVLDNNQGITIDEILISVEELYKKADKDKTSKKILETANEKWMKNNSYES